MKVLHLVNTLSAGGAELHLLTLCRELRRTGIEPVVACLRERIGDSRSLRGDFREAGVRVVDLGADARFDYRFPARFVALVRRERPQLVHTHLPRADFAGAIARVVSPSVPWICSVHDVHSESWSAAPLLPLLGALWRRADGLIAISHAVRDWLVGRFGVAPSGIRVIHYGIRPELFARAAVRSAHRGFTIGTIGRLEARKEHETLVRAMPDLLREIPGARLRIAGHDPENYAPRLRALVADLGLGERVELAGFVHDVPRFLHDLDAFAFASRAEGFGQVVLEAMAAGDPVVASRIAPLDEIVADGESGLLVKSGDAPSFARALVWIARNPAAAGRMVERAHARVAKLFSVERMTAETTALYEALA